MSRGSPSPREEVDSPQSKPAPGPSRVIARRTRIKDADRTTKVYTSMVLYYASRLRCNSQWLDHHRQRNERQTASARRAFTKAMKGVRDAGFEWEPRGDEQNLPPDVDDETRLKVRAAKLAWRKLKSEERNSRNWERLLVASSQRIDKQLRTDLAVLIAAHALHGEHFRQSRLKKSRWGVISKTVLSSVRLRQGTKGHL